MDSLRIYNCYYKKKNCRLRYVTLIYFCGESGRKVDSNKMKQITISIHCIKNIFK